MNTKFLVLCVFLLIVGAFASEKAKKVEKVEEVVEKVEEVVVKKKDTMWVDEDGGYSIYLKVFGLTESLKVWTGVGKDSSIYEIFHNEMKNIESIDGKETYMSSRLRVLTDKLWRAYNLEDMTEEYVTNFDNLLAPVLKLLVDQAVTNPQIYTSHGADHGVRVGEIIINLIDNNSVFREAVIKKYGINPHTSEQDIEIIVGLLGLLHDIGYADLEHCFEGKINMAQKLADAGFDCGDNKGLELKTYRKIKFLHAKIGERMLQAEDRSLLKRATKWLNLGWTETEQDITQDKQKIPAQRKLVNDDILEAIEYHNSDVSICEMDKYASDASKDSQVTLKDTTSGLREKCIYKTTPEHFTHFLPQGKYFKRDFVIAKLDEKPLVFLIRLADNMDFSYSRLKPMQRDERFENCMRLLTANKIKDTTDEVLNTHCNFVEENMKPALKKMNHESYLHFYSNFIVEKSKIEYINSEQPYFLMTVKFRTVTDENLAIYNNDNKWPAIFQIQRMAESMETNFVGEDKFMDSVKVNLEMPTGYKTDDIFYPLSHFRKCDSMEACDLFKTEDNDYQFVPQKEEAVFVEKSSTLRSLKQKILQA